jgi:excisionase family DNA binding protein
MSSPWDDEYLTVEEIAERLRLNQQTVRNWIDDRQLRAVRIGRRVRVARSDVERALDRGATMPIDPGSPTVVPAEVIEELAQALEPARELLAHVTGARRADVVKALEDLADAVSTAVTALAEDSNTPAVDGEEPGAEEETADQATPEEPPSKESTASPDDASADSDE